MARFTAGSRQHWKIAGKPGRARSQAGQGMKQRRLQRKRLTARRAGRSS